MILAMSEAMLQHAEAGEWLELACLESQRRALIARDMQVPPQNADGYTRILQRILSLDTRIKALAQSGQTAIAKQLHAIGLGRSAVRAYTYQAR